VRILPRPYPEVEHDLDLRLPHARGGCHGGAGSGVHPRERHRLRSGRHRRRPRRRRLRASPVVLLRLPPELLRGGGEVPGGVADTVDPLAGSYFVESLTNEIEERARAYLDKIDGMGGAVAAIEAGFYQDEIHESAFRIHQAVESGERVVVGVNRYQEADDSPVEIQQIDETEVGRQIERVRTLRAERDQTAVARALGDIESAARGTSNLIYPMTEALRLRATVG